MPSCRFQGVLLSILEYPQTWHCFSRLQHFPCQDEQVEVGYLGQCSVGGHWPDVKLQVCCQRQPKAPATIPEGKPEGNALLPSSQSSDSLDGPCQCTTAPTRQFQPDFRELSQRGAKPPLLWEPFFGGKKKNNLRSLATLSQSCCKPPFEEDAGAVCLPLQGEMLPLTQEMSSSVCQ